VVAVFIVVSLVLAACGDDGTGRESASPPTAPAARAELQHIHGLGVNARTGALYIATHTGLFQAAKDQTKVERIGNSTQDIMGFSVVSQERFIGSGHPAPDQDLPPSLGLIESRDGGRTWKNISLLGQADFHVLRSAGSRIYGFDSSQGRLMVSSDGGQHWRQRTPPAAMFDLAIDPQDPDRIVVSTERGIFWSKNAAKSWRQLAGDLAGLLAWPGRHRLYLVDAQGRVLRSRTDGQSFAAVGTIGGPPVAFVSHGSELYAALGDATVKRSTDGGRSWSLRATP
jgi:hypothetical protein